MKLEVSKKHFCEGIQITERAISTRSTMPILGNILIQTQKSSIKLSATDLEVGIETTLPCSVEKEGEISVSGRLLSDIVSIIPKDKLTINVDEKNIMTISTEGSTYHINGLPSTEFPKLPEVSEKLNLTIEKETLRKMIKQTVFATSTDETRIILTGMLLEIEDGKAALVATDGHRLARSLTNIKYGGEPTPTIFPKKCAEELSRILLTPTAEDVLIKIGESQILFELKDIKLVSRVIEGQFPEYKKVIPGDFEVQISANTEELLNAVKGASIVARENNNVVKLSIEGKKLSITADTADVGNAYEEVDIKKEGKDLSIAFNARYLIDVLSNFEEETVSMKATNEISPLLITKACLPADRETDSDYIHIIMPVKLE